MSGQRKPETYNSQGLVRAAADSLNSSQASLMSRPDSNCCGSLDSSIENSIPQLFLVISNGLHPGLATELVLTIVESLTQLSQYLTSVFTYGLKTRQVDTAVVIVEQFREKNKYHDMALVYSMNTVIQSRIDVIAMASFMATVYKKLDRTGSLTPLIVDTLIRWISPSTMNKKKEVIQARAAKQLVQQAGSDMCRSSVSSYVLVYSQVRAGLLGGGLWAETREVLLDMMVVMGRQMFPGEDKFVVKIHEEDVTNIANDVQKHLKSESAFSDKEESVPAEEEVKKVKSDIKDGNLGGVSFIDSGFVCSFAADIAKIKETNTKVEKQGDEHDDLDADTSKIHLISPAMFEEVAAEMVPVDLAPDVLHLDGICLSEDKKVLGQLLSTDSGRIYPVTDQSTIGRSSVCSIMVSGREVSRVHARVVVIDDKVAIESLSKTNKIRINGKVSPGDQEVRLMDGDSIQVGREMFVWHSEGGREMVSQDTNWDEKEETVGPIEDSCVGINEEELVTQYVEGGVPPTLEYSIDQKNSVSDDSESSVVVEMANFIE